MSLTALAAAIHFTKGYLSKIENGKARANRNLAEACDRALNAKGALLALAADPPERPRRGPGGLMGLPNRTRHFVGRETELAQLSAMLLGRGVPPVCVVTGMAGAGKTALAVAAASVVAEHFPEGCLFLDLLGHTPGARQLSVGEGLYRLLRMLDVPAERIPADVDGRANLARDRLRGRRILLLLDNVRTAEQVHLLLPGEAACRVIITSRGRLPALDDAWHLPIDMLPAEDALALFRSVAGERMPEEEGTVMGIVSNCGRLPLAIRIAAARFAGGGWTAAALHGRLTAEATRLSALDDGERSVAAAFGVSYTALPDDQRRLFGLLALHPGTAAETAAVEALAGDERGDVDRILDRLHDAHLLTRNETGHVELHDLIRVFATRFALPELAADEQNSAAARLVDHTLAMVVAADELVEPHRFRPSVGGVALARPPFADQDGALRWLRTQWPTLVEIVELAVDRERYRSCWHLAFVLRAFFFREKLFHPWIRTHRRALRAARVSGDLIGMGMILNNLGMVYLEMGQLTKSVDCHQQAHRHFTELGDARGATDARSSLAWAKLYLGESRAALDDLTVVLAAYRRMGRTRNVVIALRGMAFALTAMDRHSEASAVAQEACDLAQLPLDAIMSVNCLAWVHFRANALDDAEHHYRSAADLASRAGSDYERARALTGCGNVAASRRDFDAAARWWSEAARYPATLNPTVGEAKARLELENA